MNAPWLSGEQRGDPVKMICAFKSPISLQSGPVNVQKLTSLCVKRCCNMILIRRMYP